MRTKTLEYIDLSNNKIKADGGFALSIVIKENTQLKTLLLGMNKIDDSNCARIIKSLAYNTAIEELDLSTNNLGELSTYALEIALKSNNCIKSLDFSYTNFAIIKELWDAIISNPSLIKIDLRNTKVLESEREIIQKQLVSKEIQLQRNQNLNR